MTEEREHRFGRRHDHPRAGFGAMALMSPMHFRALIGAFSPSLDEVRWPERRRTFAWNRGRAYTVFAVCVSM